MNTGFDSIQPTPTYPVGVTQAALGIDWESRVVIVRRFKTSLKEDLRDAQDDRCCFCRRVVSDNYALHLEHFVDKAVYASFTFEICNLALACGICNSIKNASQAKLNTRGKKRAQRLSRPFVASCVTLAVPVLGPPYVLPVDSESYRWVHPHFDRYSRHIAIEKDWIFKWLSPKGRRTVREAGLNELTQIELRALQSRLKKRSDIEAPFPQAYASELDEYEEHTVRAAVERIRALRRLAARTGPQAQPAVAT